MKKIIIAVCDDFTKEIITHCAKAAMPSLQIIASAHLPFSQMLQFQVYRKVKLFFKIHMNIISLKPLAI